MNFNLLKYHLGIWWYKRKGGILLGTVISLPFMPILIQYLISCHLNYTYLYLNKILILLFLFFLIITFPAGVLKKNGHYAVITILLLITLWCQAAGFYSLSLLGGFSSIIIIRGLLSNSSIFRIFAEILIGMLLLTPFPAVDVHFVNFFRKISLFFSDQILVLLKIPFTRVGISYFVGNNQLAVWERCSGFTAIRGFLIIFAFIFLIQNKYYKFIFITPLIAIFSGIICNTLRITAHLLFVYSGFSVSVQAHEWIGIFIFIFILSFPAYFLINVNSFKLKDINCPNLQSVPAIKFVKITTLFYFFGILFLFVSSFSHAKNIEHKYQIKYSLSKQPVHSNSFTEYPGGGGWFLLEHPVDHCLALQGWDLDRENMFFNRNGYILKLQERITIGNRTFTNRYQASYAKLVYPQLWNKPISLEIDITIKSKTSHDIKLADVFFRKLLIKH